MTGSVAAPRRRPFLLIVGALFILEVALILMASQSGQASPVLTWAFVFDLIVGPVVVCGICRGWNRMVQPGLELFEALAVGLIILRFVVPSQLRLPEAWLEAPWLLVEVGVFVLVLSRFRAIRAGYHSERAGGRDTFQSLYVSMENTLGKALAGLMCLEVWSWLTLLRYRALRKSADVVERFTYFKRSIATTLYPALGFVVLMEAIAAHVLLFALVPPDWRFVVWIVTFVDVYALVLIFSSYAAMLVRPHRIAGETLQLWAGVGGWIDVPFQDIDTIAPWRQGTGSGSIQRKSTPQHKISPLGTNANVRIDLHFDVRIKGPGGMRNKAAKRILLFVDEPEVLVERVQQEVAVTQRE